MARKFCDLKKEGEEDRLILKGIRRQLLGFERNRGDNGELIRRKRKKKRRNQILNPGPGDHNVLGNFLFLGSVHFVGYIKLMCLHWVSYCLMSSVHM